MDFNEWLKSLPGAPTPTVAGKKAGVVSTTLIRHAAKGQTTADNVIAIARAYNVSPIDALVATGHLGADEASSARLDLRMALKGATVEELWDAMAEKIDGSRLFIEHFPRFGDLDISIDGSAPPVSPPHVMPIEDDGTVTEFNYLPEEYAADSSPDIVEERLARGEDPFD
ncbi:DNA-binding protein [Corynebacterium rouxii]|uniref:DNA-binding protein n=1 Tax=Corynebacterium rouxii TaxID=2719119 RepID=A0ABU3PJR0_9CORY|nr:DNA-binding protein [Corynebacterium rouxii]MDT9407895.1 DNA-binding protein [Corynebacterium rouxii]MDT9410077.1 DNA-binding protein [Corynebacterium rouxii]